jgi:hypothetical protein
MAMTMRPSIRYVISALLAATAFVACGGDDPVGPVDPPSEFIAVRRAWLPGERDSTIAAIIANQSWAFMSDYAAEIYHDTDSVTVIAANPDFSVSAVNQASLLLLEPRFAVSWNIAGFDIVNININPVPNDTTHWIGVFWSNPAEPTWKGFAYGGGGLATNTTLPRTDINTVAFEATGNKVGAGGGEFRTSTATYWQANGPIGGAVNDMQVTAASYGAAATVTTGPFLGGTMAAGSMQGRLQKISMTRISGATAPNPMTVDYDFRGAPIGAARIVCVFNSPCTTNVPALMASLRANVP